MIFLINIFWCMKKVNHVKSSGVFFVCMLPKVLSFTSDTLVCLVQHWPRKFRLDGSEQTSFIWINIELFESAPPKTIETGNHPMSYIYIYCHIHVQVPCSTSLLCNSQLTAPSNRSKAKPLDILEVLKLLVQASDNSHPATTVASMSSPTQCVRVARPFQVGFAWGSPRYLL